MRDEILAENIELIHKRLRLITNWMEFLNDRLKAKDRLKPTELERLEKERNEKP